jgi:hypothetical protein
MKWEGKDIKLHTVFNIAKSGFFAFSMPGPFNLTECQVRAEEINNCIGQVQSYISNRTPAVQIGLQA